MYRRTNKQRTPTEELPGTVIRKTAGMCCGGREGGLKLVSFLRENSPLILIQLQITNMI